MAILSWAPGTTAVPVCAPTGPAVAGSSLEAATWVRMTSRCSASAAPATEVRKRLPTMHCCSATELSQHQAEREKVLSNQSHLLIMCSTLIC